MSRFVLDLCNRRIEQPDEELTDAIATLYAKTERPENPLFMWDDPFVASEFAKASRGDGAFAVDVTAIERKLRVNAGNVTIIAGGAILENSVLESLSRGAGLPESVLSNPVYAHVRFLCKALPEAESEVDSALSALDRWLQLDPQNGYAQLLRAGRCGRAYA